MIALVTDLDLDTPAADFDSAEMECGGAVMATKQAPGAAFRVAY